MRQKMWAHISSAPLLITVWVWLTVPAYAQTFGIIADWSWNQSGGQVYAHAQTWADYSFSYYYELRVSVEIDVQTSAGSTTVCLQGGGGTPTADAYCTTSVSTDCSDPPSVTFTSTHEVDSNMANWDPYGVSLVHPSWPSSSGQSWTASGISQVISGFEVFSTGTQQNQAMPSCPNYPTPTGESSIYVGWGAGGYDLAGAFVVSLLGPASYAGRTVHESFGGFADTCYFTGSAYSPLNAVVPGPPWTVTAYNTLYGVDNVGMRDDQASWIRYYQGLGLSCGWYATQSMSINNLNGWPIYAVHQIGFGLNANSINSYRDGASGTISWQ